MKLLKRILLSLAVLFILIQFIRPDMNSSTVPAEKGITSEFSVPPDVHRVLKQSCFDCHSNRTVYPWYAHIQPVGWWLADHIKEGKEHLNFDDFAGRRPRVQYHAFEEVQEMITEDDMPLPSYLILHRDAVLSDESKEMLIRWTKAMRDSMKLHYPPDSLERRRIL